LSLAGRILTGNVVTKEHTLIQPLTAAAQGLSIDETGKQHYLDASVAYKRAVLNCIDYLSKFGYTKQQVCAGLTPVFQATYICTSTGSLLELCCDHHTCCNIN